MAFKPRTREQSKTSGVINTGNLTSLLNQTGLSDSDDRQDIALFQFLETFVELARNVISDVSNSLKKTDKINLVGQISDYLQPAHGGSFSSVYTPTLTNVANLTASVASRLGYFRTGNTVTVFGKVNVQTTGAGDTRLRISLPILSYFLLSSECGGVACCSSIAGEVGAIFGDTVNFDAELQWQTAGAATFDMFFSFSYQLIAKT